MVGYDTEDKAYCMELTYNYGLSSYSEGTGLLELGLYVPSVADSLAKAAALGFQVKEGVVIGPDGYRFRLFPLPEGRNERFVYVLCCTGNLLRSVQFYTSFLGMVDTDLPTVPGLKGKAAAVSYTSAAHPHRFEPVVLVLVEDGSTPKITPWEGRHAFAIPAAQVEALHKRFKAECPKRIMHDGGDTPIMLQEKLGTLFIFIARDPEGYELCLVSRETMLPAAVEAVMGYDPKLLDWETRDQRIAAITAARAEIEALIAKSPVMVFSAEYCPFCRKVKETFKSLGVSIAVKEIQDEQKQPLVSNVEAWRAALAAMTNLGTSVPKVFIKGKSIGGSSDVAALQKSGQLLAMCVDAGAVEEEKRPDPAATDVHFFVNGHVATAAEYDAARL